MRHLRRLLQRLAIAFAMTGSGLLVSPVAAVDVAHGQQLYSTWCAGCHGADPRQSQPHLAANNPKALRDAIDLVGEMGFLKNVLSGADIDDIAAYIGSVADTGVPVLNPTPASLDFSHQDVGQPGVEKTLLLTNLGSMPLTIQSITATPADFAVAGNCTGNRNPSTTCALQIRFTPSAAGSIAGRISIAVAQTAAPMTVPLLGAGVLPASTPLPVVVEYYEPELDHYFITADAGEQAFVDSGAVGRWLRTGNAYRSGGPAQVCRFYGNTAPDATGKPLGPNSHFYTADPAECNGLKAMFDASMPSWRFESLDFGTTVPTAGACPAGTVPVYRAYNNGSARRIDSNHRITTNRTAIEQAVGRGWIDEGVVMCAPGSLQ
jgi:cytochrome c553